MLTTGGVTPVTPHSPLARRSDHIEALAQELGGEAIAITADVTDRASLEQTAARVRDALGGADILVNNAGQLTAQDSGYVVALAVGRPRRVAINEVLIGLGKQPW